MCVRQIVVAFCIAWKFFHLSNCTIAYMKYSKIKAINWGLPLAGNTFNITPIATTKATNHIQCMTQCTKAEKCIAVNVGPSQSGERECEMLAVTRHSKSQKRFTVKAGWTYVGPKVCAKNYLHRRC